MNEFGTKPKPDYYLKHKYFIGVLATAYYSTEENRYIVNRFNDSGVMGMGCFYTSTNIELPLNFYTVITEEEYFLEML